MTQVQFDDQQPEPPAQKPQGPGGRLVAAGVVGAIALGAGMGLWARPAPPPQAQPSAKPIAPEDTVRPALQIVVDDGPAPIGPLLEVLPGDATANEAPPPPLMAEPVAPRRSAAGLMKVDAVVAAEPLLAVPAVKVEEKPRPLPATEKAEAPRKAKIDRKAGAPKIEKAKAPKAEPRPDRIKIAEAKAKKAEVAKAEKARAEKAIRLAKAEKAEKIRAGKLAKAEKAKAVKLAKAEARKPKAEKPKAEPKRLASLVKTVKTAPAKIKAEAAKAKKVQLAKSRPKPKVERASTKPAPVAKAKPPARKPIVPRGEGPMRVARNDGCASADPGEAVVCADGRLGVRDRQLQQAYRNAEAAGVPASALRRQQARWLQARAAAAREAPWAVEDVYEARISELNDLIRDAREN